MAGHDVSGEARDQNGRWTANGGYDVDTSKADPTLSAKVLHRVRDALLEYGDTLGGDQSYSARVQKGLEADGVKGLTAYEYGTLKSYFADSYKRINGALRSGLVDGKTELGDPKNKTAANFRGVIRAMDDGLAKLPEYSGESVRLMYADEKLTAKALKAYKVGNVVTEDGYTSSNMGKEPVVRVNDLFKTEDKVDHLPNFTIRIDGVKGRAIPPSVAVFDLKEKEVVYPRGTKFKVAKVEKDENGYVVHLTKP